jgi:hypothetical protein
MLEEGSKLFPLEGFLMMISILFALTGVLSVAVVFLYLRNRLLHLRLQNGANGYAALANEHKNAAALLSARESVIAGLESELRKSEQSRKETSVKAAATESEFLGIKTSLERKLANAELQRDHILAKYETMQHELEDERLEAQERLEAERKSRRAVDPAELDTLRRRAAQNEHLYHSMRSLRDMAEERNRNWESALRKLATWILTSSPAAVPNDPILSKPVGPLVGEALSRIGQSILDVTPSEERRAEATHLASVDM